MKCTINDLPDILNILEKHMGDIELLSIRELFNNPLVSFYINNTKDIVMFFIPADRGVWSQHIYKIVSRDKIPIEKFAIDSSIKFIKSTPGVMAIMNIVKKKDRHLRLFMGYFRKYGTKRVAIFPNGDSMYVTTRDSYLLYMEENNGS